LQKANKSDRIKFDYGQAAVHSVRKEKPESENTYRPAIY